MEHGSSISREEATIQVDCFASQYSELHPRSALKVSAIDVDVLQNTIDITFDVLVDKLGKGRSARQEAEKFVRALKSEESSAVADFAVKVHLVGDPAPLAPSSGPAVLLASEALEIIERYFEEHGDEIEEPVSVCDTHLAQDGQMIVVAFVALPGIEAALAEHAARKVWARVLRKHPELEGAPVDISVRPSGC